MVVDLRQPWKLPRLPWKEPRYLCTTSISEWRALLAKAKSGDSNAEWEVSDSYADGRKDKSGNVIVRRSTRKSAEWLKLAAEHGCAYAQNTLGVRLGNGDPPFEKNPREALMWLKKAFRGGDLSAASNIALTYRENDKLSNAVQWLRRAVASGYDDDAFVELGIHYYWGKGVRQNPAAAVRCFRRATKATYICDASKDDAHFYLGMAYLEGKGVKRSIVTAERFFRRANIDDDHLAAQRMLRDLRRRKPLR